MRDPVSQLSESELAELAALADGTLPADRRPEVEARVAASPERQDLLERQRQSLALTAALEDEPSASLEATVRKGAPRTRRRSLLGPRLVALGAAVAAIAVAAVVLTGGPGAPSVAQAAELATKAPSEPAPASVDGSRLAVDVEGVAFPDYAEPFGWQAIGARRGRVSGRDATVVYYSKGSRQVAYAIVAGESLPSPSGGQTTSIGGIPYQAVFLDDRLVVTWQRRGRTCVLLGDASDTELVDLASWANS